MPTKTTPSWAIPRRSPWVAGLLSLLAPCTGHLYVGRPGRSLLLFVALLAIQLMVLAIAFRLPPSFAAIVTFAVAALVVWAGYCLFVLVDAMRRARRYRGRRATSRWFVCGPAIVAVWLGLVAMGTLAAAVKPHLPWQMFDMPSTSMEPTLRKGEWILADTSYFKQYAPSRGDVVVYHLPHDPSTKYIKRVVALAGDRIAFRDGRMLVNGATVVEPYVKPGDTKAFLNTTAEFVVPADHLFVAGDNRANSTDSRMWSQHGPVPIENVVGRATDIFLTDAPDRMGYWVGSPPT
jgi:signal peptidase I